MIGVKPDLIQQVYEPSFWPKRVIFNRFDFRLGKRFLDQSQHQQEKSKVESNKQITVNSVSTNDDFLSPMETP